MEQKYYSQFWLDYCNSKFNLDPKFIERDLEYFEESTQEDHIVDARVRTNQYKQYIEYKNQGIADIEGKQIWP